MLYNVLMVPGGSKRELEAVSLAELVAQLEAPFRQISIGSGVQSLPVLGPLNDLPPVWGKADLPKCPVGDSVSLTRLLVKGGTVAGETGLCRLTVDSASLLSWADTALFAPRARLFATCLSAAGRTPEQTVPLPPRPGWPAGGGQRPKGRKGPKGPKGCGLPQRPPS